MPTIGPYSRPDALSKLDGRTKEAALLRRTRRSLISHAGGQPSAVQMALIDRASWLTLHLATLDAKTAEGKLMTEHDSRTYLAWSNSLGRTLKQLGLKGAAERPPSLREHIAARSAGVAA